jgi:sorting nexin-29
MVKLTVEDNKSLVRIQTDLSAVVTSKNDPRQGDALACLLFNIALEKTVRDSDIQTNGTIFYKSVQLLAYADDRDIIARTQLSLEEAFLTLEDAARRMGLRIDREKTKYMITSQSAKQSENTIIGNYTFEVVQTLTCLGSSVICDNDNRQEIKKIILIANRCFYGLKNQLNSHVLSWKSKIILYKTLIRQVLTYAS